MRINVEKAENESILKLVKNNINITKNFIYFSALVNVESI